MIRGVLFDLWNTLAYNATPKNPIVALGRIFGIAGRPGWVATVERAIMLAPLPGIAEAVTRLEETTGRALSESERAEIIGLWRGAVPTASLFPDVLPVLDSLRARLRLGILSNTQSFDLGFVVSSGLDARLDAAHYSWATGRLKPDPKAFQAAAEALGLPASDVLMVGDNLRDDILGARAAGLSALLIRRPGSTLSHREPPAGEPPITSLDDLPDRL